MQRNEVIAIFEQEKENFFRGKNASENPTAIILGGQPACGKSTLIHVAKADHSQDRKSTRLNSSH